MSLVVAIDPTTAGVSLARCEGTGTPKTAYVEAPRVGGHGVSEAIARISGTADAVIEKVLSNSVPDLVVMSKLTLLTLNADPSGPRRAGLWWAIAAKLRDHKIPIVEVAQATAMKWLLGYGVLGGESYTMIGSDVQNRWPDIKDRGRSYRMTTPNLSVMGAMLLGVETDMPVTEARLRVLRTLEAPQRFSVPDTVAAWTEAAHGKELRTHVG